MGKSLAASQPFVGIALSRSGSVRVLFIYPNLMLQTMLPASMTVLAAVLKRLGHVVDIFDTTFYAAETHSSNEYRVQRLQMQPFDTNAQRKLLRPCESMVPDLRAKVEKFQPHLIAMSALEDTFVLGAQLLGAIRDFGVPHLVGGVYPTFAPELVIAHPSVDVICIGEGEGALVDLCDALARGAEYSAVSNLWVKQRDGGVRKNPIRPAIDLDELPQPDYSLFPEERLYFPMGGKLLRIGAVETHRGCPYRCTFCNSPSQMDLYGGLGTGSFFRLKSVKNVHRELRYLVDEMKVEYIRFPADTFLAMPDGYLYEFAEMYKEIGLPFWCQTRPETLTKERVRILDEMGCADISIGIEHGNETFRREVVGRNYSNTLLLERICNVRNASFGVRVNNIVGLPKETRRLTWDTIEINRKIHSAVQCANAFHFAPYRGTRLRKLALSLGYITEDTRIEHNTKDTVLNMPQYSRDEINGAIRTFNMYLRFPESYFAKIAVAERFDDEGNAMFEALRDEFIQRYYATPSAVDDLEHGGTT
jgi:anaerobic magnesium-protoporphyrin IX monomethyl ester cyclase